MSAAATEDDGAWERAARALEAIADLLDSMDGLGSAAAPTARLRDDARALAELGPVDLERADQLKAALQAGVDAIAAVAGARGGGWLQAWVSTAGDAVEAIDVAVPLGLQRAAAQDALRALADAVLLAWQLGSG